MHRVLPEDFNFAVPAFYCAMASLAFPMCLKATFKHRLETFPERKYYCTLAESTSLGWHLNVWSAKGPNKL